MNYLKKFHGENWHTPEGRVIRDIIYALKAGLVATVAFLAGVTASNLNSKTILFAALANLVSGTLAIFFGAYISTKSQVDFFESQIEREKRELDELPQRETEEVREILCDMGLEKEQVETATRYITSDKKRWLGFMAKEELGLFEETFDNPVSIGLISGISYLLGAVVPILPFIIFDKPIFALKIAAGLVVIFLFAVGLFKALFIKQKWIIGVLEMVLIGIVSCAIGFAFGRLAARLFTKI